MKQSKIAAFLLVITLIFTLSLSPRVALAQSTWSHELDLTQGPGGFSITNDPEFSSQPGVYVPGSGWTATNSVERTNGYYYHWIGIHQAFSESVLSSIEITFSITPGQGANLQSMFYVGTTTSWELYAGNPSSSPVTVNLSSTPVTDIYIQGISAADGAAPTTTNPGSVVISRVVVTGPGTEANDPFSGVGSGSFRPITTSDTVSITDTNHTVTTVENANVHLITGGTIAQVTHNTWLQNNWSVIVSPTGLIDEPGAITYNNLQGVNGTAGDSVTAGCVIARADAASSTGASAQGKITLAGPSGIIDNWPDFADPLGNTPCDAAKYTSTTCANLNPNFANSGEHWLFNGNAAAEEGQVSLAGGSYISQNVELDNEQAYHVTLFASLSSITDVRQADIGVTVGNTQSTLHLSETVSGEWVELTSQDLDIGEPSTTGDYQFSIHAPAAASIQIVPTILVRFACISTAPVQKKPGDCYFEDGDLVADSWEHDEEVTFKAKAPTPARGAPRPGNYTVPNEKTIWHDVDISAYNNTDTNYTLVVPAEPALVGAPLVASSYGRIHAYIEDADTHSLIQDIGEADITGRWLAVPLSLPFTLDATEHVAGNLVIENISGEINEDSGWDIIIDGSPCLSVEGGDWPGYGTADTTGLGGMCVNINPPSSSPLAELPSGETNSDWGTWIGVQLQWLGAWIQYGFLLLRNALLCTLFDLFMKIYAVARSLVEGFALFMVWLSLEALSLAKGLLMLFLSIITWWLNTPIAKWLYDHIVDGLILGNYLADLMGKLGHFLYALVRLPAFIVELILELLSYLRDAVNTVPDGSVTFVCTTNTATTGLCGGMALMDRMLGNVPVIDVLFYIMFGLLLISNFIWTSKKLTELLDMFSQAVQK